MVKIILLFIRLYYWSIPTYVATGFLALINWCIYNTCQTQCVSACTIAKKSKRQTIPV